MHDQNLQQDEEKNWISYLPGKLTDVKRWKPTELRLKVLSFQFVLPAIQVSLFCMAVGQDPKQLPVAVVNNELFAHNGTMTESCQNGKI